MRAGTEIKVTTERPAVALSLSELDKGSWVIFELPGFTTASLGRGAGQPGRAAQGRAPPSYYKGNGALWVKLVSTGESGTGLASGPGTGNSASQASR